jgi:hypothetical protein
MDLRLHPHRTLVRIVLLVLLAVGLYCFFDMGLKQQTIWMHCQDSSCICHRGHQWCLVKARWKGARLECECCLESLEPGAGGPLLERPSDVVSCHFRDSVDAPVQGPVTQNVAVHQDYLSGQTPRVNFRFHVPVPQGARSVAVRLESVGWKTRYIDLPPRPVDPLDRWLPF